MKQASIILITYNSQSFITECLNSLYKTTGIDKSEIIVWDNASTDNTVEIINKNYPTVHLFESKENLGFGSAVNKAMTHVSSDFIVLLNPDTQVSKNWLLPLLDTLKKNTNVAAVNSKTKIVSNNLEFIQNAGNYVFSDGHSRDRGAVVSDAKKQLYEKDSKYYAVAKEVAAFSGVSVAIKRNIFEKLGGFDEHMFMYYEDVDLSIRMRKQGYSIWYQPLSELTHTHSASSEEWSDLFVYQTELNRLLFLWKHFDFKTILFEMFTYKLSTVFQLIKLNKRFFLRLKVLFSLLTNLPYLLTYRIKNKT